MLDLHAPWSLSKSDLAGKCPYAFKLRYIDKVKSGTSTHAQIGVTAHRVQELVLTGTVPKEALDLSVTESPDLTHKEVEAVRALLPNIAAFRQRCLAFHTRHQVVQEFYEQKWAIDRNFNAIDYDSPDAFFRGIVDYAMLTQGGSLVVMDHKSGRRHPVAKYAPQLDAYAVLGLATFPAIKSVHAALHYIATGDVDWHHLRPADDIRRMLQPYLKETLSTRAAGLVGYPHRPNKLCKYCDYLQHCEVGRAKVASEAEEERLARNQKARERNAEKKRLKQLDSQEVE